MAFLVYYDINDFIEFYNIIFKKCINLNIDNHKDLEKIVEIY